MGKQWKQCQTLFFWATKSLQMVTAAMKLKDTYSLEGRWNVRSQEQLPRSFVLLSVLMMTLSLLILVLSLEIPHSTQLVKVNHWNISRDGMSMVSKENGWVIYYL